MLEKWNVGMAPFGQINACGAGLEAPILPPSALTNDTLKTIIPPFHHSIIPGWKKKNGWIGIPYYQAFAEIPLH